MSQNPIERKVNEVILAADKATAERKARKPTLIDRLWTAEIREVEAKIIGENWDRIIGDDNRMFEIFEGTNKKDDA